MIFETLWRLFLVYSGKVGVVVAAGFLLVVAYVLLTGKGSLKERVKRLGSGS